MDREIIFVSWNGFKVHSPNKYKRTITPQYLKYSDKLISIIGGRLLFDFLGNYDEYILGLPMTWLEHSLFKLEPIDNKIRTFLAIKDDNKVKIVITVSSVKYQYVISYDFLDATEKETSRIEKIILKRKRRYGEKAFKVIYRFKGEEVFYSVLGLILISLLKKMFDTTLMIINASEYLFATNREYIWIEEKKIKIQLD